MASDVSPAWRSVASQVRLWTVTAAALAADLISKERVFAWLGWPDQPGPHTCTVLPNVLEFTTSTNLGAATGILSGHVSLFVVVGVVALAAFLLFFARSDRRQWFFHVGIGLVLGGAIGNIYDRLVFGKVRDFIKFTTAIDADWIGGWPRTGLYPYIFNVADAALVVGVAAIMLSTLHRAGKTGARG